MGWRFGADGKAEWVDDIEFGAGGAQVARRGRPQGTNAPLEAAGGPAALIDAGVSDFAAAGKPAAVGTTLIDAGASLAPRPSPAGEAPTLLPPELVEAPREPIVSGVTMRRVAPGAGEYGERADLMPATYTRTRPISVQEGVRSGIVAAPVQGRVPSETPAGVALVDAMRAGRDRAMTMSGEAERTRVMEATRAERWGLGGRGGATSTKNRSADAVLETLRGIDTRQRQADIETDAQLRRPQAAAGNAGNSTWDPVTKKWTTQVAERGAPQKAVPQTWDEYTPEDLEGIVNRTVKSMLPPEQEKIFYQKLNDAKTPEARAQVYRDFAPNATPEQRVILDNAYEALTRKSIVKGKGGGKGGGKKTIGGIAAN